MGKTKVLKTGFSLPQSAIDKLTTIAKKSRMSKSFVLETLIEFNRVDDLSKLYPGSSTEPIYSRKYLSSEKREEISQFHSIRTKQVDMNPALSELQKAEAFALDPETHPEFNGFKEAKPVETTNPTIKKLQQQLRKVFKNEK